MSPPFHLYSPPADAGLPSLRGSKTSKFSCDLSKKLRHELTKLQTRVIKDRLIQVACVDDSSEKSQRSGDSLQKLDESESGDESSVSLTQ